MCLHGSNLAEFSIICASENAILNEACALCYLGSDYISRAGSATELRAVLVNMDEMLRAITWRNSIKGCKDM